MRTVLIAAMSLFVITSAAQAAAPVTGKWITAERDSIVEIGQCGTHVCGHVLRLSIKAADGKPMLDRNNPDPGLRTRPIQGLTILTDFSDGGANWTGRIYDPKSGKSYKSYLSRNPDGTLKVQGCVATFLCRTFTWTPAR